MFAYLDMGHVFLLISGTMYLLACRCINSSPFKTAESEPVVARVGAVHRMFQFLEGSGKKNIIMLFSRLMWCSGDSMQPALTH